MTKPKKSSSKIDRRQFLEKTGLSVFAAALFPRSATAAQTKTNQKQSTEIVSVRIYPAIGIARIGNSSESDGYFIGPEVTEPVFAQANDTRDMFGAIKRQAARFRVYGYNENGEVVRELTSESAEITWHVHLANKKAAWYRFTVALDIPESRNVKVARRNASVVDRESLVIQTGNQSISGNNQTVKLDKGRFQTTPVTLGELRTDEQGRLLVLGGIGKAESPTQKPIYNIDDADSFNNADGWYDDTSDGPVAATVRINGQAFEAKSSWVVVAPPNFAPNMVGWRTMYDLLMDLYTVNGWQELPKQTSFTRDIAPLLLRLSNLQWVNKGFADLFGAGAEFDFSNPDLIGRLSDPNSNADIRAKVFKNFRLVSGEASDIDALTSTAPTYLRLWPMLYGDSYGTFDQSKSASLMLSGLRLTHLKRWLSGDFINDWHERAKPARKLSDVPLQAQPEMLNEAALQFCLADAFHPGCELTWPMRHLSLYDQPINNDKSLLFRIKTADSKSRDYGSTLSAQAALSQSGPLHGQAPGDLTKWMAIPWQGDTAFCRSGYDEKFDLYIQSFWPARVPNHVLSQEDYQILIDPANSREERLQAFHRREYWTRGLQAHDTAPDQMMYMTKGFSELGIIQAKPGPRDGLLSEIPQILFVENLPPAPLKSPRGGHNKDSSRNPTINPDSDEYWLRAESELANRYKRRAGEVHALFKELQAGSKRISKADLTLGGWKSLEQYVEFRLIKLSRRR